MVAGLFRDGQCQNTALRGSPGWMHRGGRGVDGIPWLPPAFSRSILGPSKSKSKRSVYPKRVLPQNNYSNAFDCLLEVHHWIGCLEKDFNQNLYRNPLWWVFNNSKRLLYLFAC